MDTFDFNLDLGNRSTEEGFLRDLEHHLVEAMVLSQTEGEGEYGTKNAPFPTSVSLSSMTKNQMISQYRPITQFNDITKNDKEGLMVWGTNRIGEPKLFYLQDYLFDMKTKWVEQMSADEFVAWNNSGYGKRESVDEFGHDLQVKVNQEVKTLLADGKMMFFPSSESKKPKMLRYDEQQSKLSVTDLNKEKIVEKPWFMGLGILTDFICFVSDSAKTKKRNYESELENSKSILEHYTRPANVAEIERVATENKKDYVIESDLISNLVDPTFVVEESTVEKTNYEKRQEIRQEVKLAYEDVCFLRRIGEYESQNALQKLYGEAGSVRLQREKSSELFGTGNDGKIQKLNEKPLSTNDIEGIYLCCTLSTPFTNNTKIKNKLDSMKMDMRTNVVALANNVFRDFIGDDPARLHLKPTTYSICEEGKELAERAISKCENGDPQFLAKHLSNGLMSMCVLLNSASPKEIMEPSSFCTSTTRAIAQTMDFLDAHPKVKDAMKMEPGTKDLCNGWREFYKICEKSHEQKRKLCAGESYKLDEVQHGLVQEQSIRKICAMSLESGDRISTSNLPQGKDPWEDGLERSKAGVQNSSISFITALGKDPKLMDQFTLDVDPKMENATFRDACSYLMDKLPSQAEGMVLRKNEETPLWENSRNRLASVSGEKSTSKVVPKMEMKVPMVSRVENAPHESAPVEKKSGGIGK